jgi:hypothetical protein
LLDENPSLEKDRPAQNIVLTIKGDKDMKVQSTQKWLSRITVVSLTAVVAMTLGVAIVHGQAQHCAGILSTWFFLPLTPSFLLLLQAVWPMPPLETEVHRAG